MRGGLVAALEEEFVDFRRIRDPGIVANRDAFPGKMRTDFLQAARAREQFLDAVRVLGRPFSFHGDVEGFPDGFFGVVGVTGVAGICGIVRHGGSLSGSSRVTGSVRGWRFAVVHSAIVSTFRMAPCTRKVQVREGKVAELVFQDGKPS
jgi:hypothetical protein